MVEDWPDIRTIVLSSLLSSSSRHRQRRYQRRSFVGVVRHNIVVDGIGGGEMAVFAAGDLKN